jgi:hypothetical protein
MEVTEFIEREAQEGRTLMVTNKPVRCARRFVALCSMTPVRRFRPFLWPIICHRVGC